jgi:hypothetical protein
VTQSSLQLIYLISHGVIIIIIIIIVVVVIIFALPAQAVGCMSTLLKQS